MDGCTSAANDPARLACPRPSNGIPGPDEERIAHCDEVRTVEISRWKAHVGTLEGLPVGNYLRTSGLIAYLDDTGGVFDALLMKSGDHYEIRIEIDLTLPFAVADPRNRA